MSSQLSLTPSSVFRSFCEQLCINFTNERLQQKFNSHTFTQEESLYQAEGVPFDKVPFLDNGPVIELLSAKPYGLMNLLDEEVRCHAA